MAGQNRDMLDRRAYPRRSSLIVSFGCYELQGERAVLVEFLFVEPGVVTGRRARRWIGFDSQGDFQRGARLPQFDFQIDLLLETADRSERNLMFACLTR